ncbi:MAG: hypothetical protein BWK77_08675 [Verrucomicrobia bacterium A1]|nr:MAG: hypothetical protein BWK77_08675 [Verrucomicrobia bacterium A1]
MSPFERLESLTLSDAERAAIAAAAVHSADFLFCGNRVRIAANTTHPLDSFGRIYNPFRLDATGPGPVITVTCRFAGEAATYLVADRAYRVRSADLIANPLPTLAFFIFTRIRSHYLVHAGCVSRGGRGIVLSGASGMGKSTLTAYLVSRGMGFLSDEVAPISRATGRVEPFPLHIGIRPGPGEDLVQDLPAADYTLYRDQKKLVDVRDLAGAAVRESVPLHAVVFLAQRPSAQVQTAAKFDGLIRVAFLGVTASFRDELFAETGAERVRETPFEPDMVAWTLRVPAPATFVSTLYAVARRHAIPIAALEHEDLDRRDFQKRPELVAIPKSAGVLELIKKIGPQQKKALLDSEFGGSLPRFVEEVGRLAQPVDFYKLSPGRLDGMIAAVEGLA